MSAAAILTCEAWPEGDHVLAYLPHVEDGHAVPQSMRSVPRDFFSRRTTPGLFPKGLRLAGGEKGGKNDVSGDVAAERMGRALFLRVWLDAIRAAYPGVRWVVRRCHGVPHPNGGGGRVAFGYVRGRVVGMVAEALP